MRKVWVVATAGLIITTIAVALQNQQRKAPEIPDVTIEANQTTSSIPVHTTAPTLPAAADIATTSASPSATPSEVAKKQFVTIKTGKGAITLQLFSDYAPHTVANFLKKVNSGFYKNLTFHRVEDWVIQGGDPKGDGTGGDKMTTELNDAPFVIGSLGVARGQDINVSNDAQFFITKKEAGWLNGKYTNFGRVTAGMDVVEKIAVGDKILDVIMESSPSGSPTP